MVSGPRSTAAADRTPKILAFVLPQFHTIPENDAWWGEGFTEWTNVRKARPLFRNHLQPRVPAVSRYYNLLDPATQDWQAALAREHGIYGFCYYHYWFAGKRLLEKPVELLLQRGKPDFPFCLAWANEPWTRAWDGGDREVLMPQDYADENDWEQHFAYLLQIFRDPRYIRVDGRPMLLIYRSASIDCAEPMLRLWRRLAERAGLPGLHIVSMRTAFPPDTRSALFDAFAEFEPVRTFRERKPFWLRKRERWIRQYRRARLRLFGSVSGAPHSYHYSGLWGMIEKRKLPERTYPGAFVDWDNTPRRGLERGIVMRKFKARAFEKGVRTQLRKALEAGAQFVFINAWNEWAEGAYMEPDEARGTFFLDTVRVAVAELQQLALREEAKLTASGEEPTYDQPTASAQSSRRQ
ncbi:MAG: glycosyltransferase WbsX family protein [Steroidobacter sp.]